MDKSNNRPAAVPARNWVAKNNRNRSARHRAATDYQRRPKHRNQETAGWKTIE